MTRSRPHVLGIDDGPFDKGQTKPVPLVAVMMECPQLLESVALAERAVDGAEATEFLADWISGLRCYPTLQAVVLGGITLAGLSVVDISALAAALERPILVVNRKNPAVSRLAEALAAAGFHDRLPILDRSPAATHVAPGLYLSWAGVRQREAEKLLRATLGKAQIPEPLRIAHIIARALETGESRGRA